MAIKSCELGRVSGSVDCGTFTFSVHTAAVLIPHCAVLGSTYTSCSTSSHVLTTHRHECITNPTATSYSAVT